MDDDTPDLQGLLLELLEQPCVTGEEEPIADWFAARYELRSEEVRRVNNSVVVGEVDRHRPTVLLVGHLDVVPPTEADVVPRVEDGRIIGRGASDMKSGLAVAMACFETAALRSGPYALRLVAYAGEEGAHEGNELGRVLAEVPGMRDAALAVVLEPTDLEVQLGCLGTLNAHVRVPGRAAHSARPWQGENALTKAGALLTALHASAPHDVDVDGLVYREVVTATQAWTENTRNVVPATLNLNLNYRFSPLRGVEEAEEALRTLVGGHGEVDIIDHAPAAHPHRADPVVDAFARAVDAPVAPKQAWTDVARFADAGVPALNYGPGLTAQAHQEGEYVPAENLDRAMAALAGFLGGAGS